MPRHFALFVLGGLVPLIASLPAWGQATDPLSVDDAVCLAVSRNPRLDAAVRDVRAATAGVRSVRALTNPTVFFAPGITSISGTGEEFLAQQPLELNGVRQARAAVANADLRGARAGSLVTLRDIVYQTKVAYYTVARAQRRSGIARELLAVAREADRVARIQVEAGARAGIDLAQTGIEVARSQREVTLADGATAESVAVLNTLLARSVTQSIPLLSLDAPDPQASGAGGTGLISPQTSGETAAQGVFHPQGASRQQDNAPMILPPGTPPTVPDAGDALATRAFSARGETRSAVALRDRFRAEAALARAEGRPDIAPQVRVGNFLRGLQPASQGQGVGIGVALTLPFFDHGSRKNRIRQAEEGAKAQESRIVAAQNDIRQEIAQAQMRFAGAETVRTSYRGGVLEQAKRLLDASQLGFREGRVSVVALLEAQRSYIGIQNEYADALTTLAIARAALERASGAVPETFLPTP